MQFLLRHFNGDKENLSIEFSAFRFFFAFRSSSRGLFTVPSCMQNENAMKDVNNVKNVKSVKIFAH